MPGPLISQFIREAVDELDLAVGKHWSLELSLCNLQMISDATSASVGTIFPQHGVENFNGLILHKIGGNARI